MGVETESISFRITGRISGLAHKQVRPGMRHSVPIHIIIPIRFVLPLLIPAVWLSVVLSFRAGGIKPNKKRIRPLPNSLAARRTHL